MLHGREISCSRISGLFAGRRRLPGHYEFRAQDPNRCKRPRWAGIVTGLALCRSDLSCHKALAPTQLAVGVATDSRPVARLVTGFGAPHGPADTRQLVGQCDGGLVVPDASLQLQSPLLKATQACGIDSVHLFRARQHRSGAVDQQRSQVDIAALGDATEIAPEATARFPGRDAEPGGKLSAAGEVAGGSRRRDHGGGIEQADTLDLAQAFDCSILGGDFLQGPLDGQQPQLQGLDLLQHGLQCRAQVAWQMVQMPGCVLDRIDRTGRQIEPELTQGAAQTVDAGGTGRLPLLTQAMQLDHRLLVFVLDRHRHDVVTSSGFEQGVGITAIVLVAAPVWPDMLRRQQFDLVTQRIARACPVMGGATCLEQHPAGGRLGHEFGELGAIEAVSFDDSAIAVRDGNLETIFLPNRCQGFYASCRTPSVCQLGFRHCQLGTWMPKKQEESISSFQRTSNTPQSFGYAFGIFAQKAAVRPAPLN